jgi:hypothetical protein
MLLLFVNSCKKDRDQQNKTEDITLLKNWFESHKEQHPTNFIKDLNPDWENTYTSITDGVLALEVNLDKPNAIAFMQSSLNNAKEERAAPQTNIRLVLLKNLITGAMDGCYMALTANSDENLRNLHYKQFTNLNGRVLYFDLKGGFVNGHIYTAGNLSNKLSKGNKSDVNDLLTLNAEGTKPNTSTGANKLMVVDVTNCNTEPIDVYTEKCSSITVGPISDPTYSAIKQPNKGKIMSGTNGNTTCTMVYAETIYLTTCDNLPAAVDGGGGYSGGGSATTTSLSKDIIDHLTDTCLKNSLKKAVDAKFGDTISKIIAKLNGNAKVKVTVSQTTDINDANGNSIDGKTTAYDNNAGIFSCSILLNESVLNNATQEYIVKVIIHETLHAYLQYTAGSNNYSSFSHEDIAKNYIEPFTNILHSIYPNLNLRDATAMAWGGLESSSLWKANFKNDTFKVGSTSTTMTFSEMKGLETAHRFGYADNSTNKCAK